MAHCFFAKRVLRVKVDTKSIDILYKNFVNKLDNTRLRLYSRTKLQRKEC